jgi:ABC-type lipoprotein export system ATPase subunit
MERYLFKDLKLEQIFWEHPYVADFFNAMVLPVSDKNVTLQDYFSGLDEDLLQDMGMNREELMERFDLFMAHMNEVREGKPVRINSICIIGGFDKFGAKENIRLTMKRGEIICVVGPTGSGKSRLLADIEWMAQKDTPTARQILVNDQVPPREWRFSLEHKLVAQLSQNMNFVVDMTAYDFIRMHAESRMVADPTETTQTIIQQANQLAGEDFMMDTPVTALSGGQSRALMIADTAFLSTSPIVLIDEIENAGIDREKALNLLVKEEKIVLIATHDPLLALMGNKRIVIKNGGIKEIITTDAKEQSNLDILKNIDYKITGLRNMIRSGNKIDLDIETYFHE